MRINRHGCPVCGFPDVTVLDAFSCTTFEICECCGSESGYEYDQNSTPERLQNLRREWVIERNCEWHGDKKCIPENWDPVKQMKAADIEIPW